MTEPTPATPRPALVFTKEDCTCTEPLFSLKYLRTHRAGSLKLIRCFPHCCPVHSFGNFCSTSIDLKATGATTDDVAYVHFQPTTDRILEPNDIIDAALVVNNTRSMENLKGEWIPSLYRYYHETRDETIYHFNQNNTFGWHYGWVGTSTKAHRTCPHRLVGYIFAHVTIHGKAMLQVVHATMSPAFIVMSYRRACYYCQKHRATTAPPKPVDGGDTTGESKQCECEGEFNIETHHPANTLPYQSKQQRGNSLPSTPPPPAAPIARPPDIERHLHILYAFVSLPSIHFFGPHLASLESRVLKSLLQPLGVSLGLNAYQKRSMVFPAFLRPMPPAPHDTAKTITSLQSVALDLLMSLVTFESIRQADSAFTAATPHLLQRDALQHAYQTWLSNIHAQLSTRLHPLNLSISQLVCHVQDAVAHIPELHTLHRSFQNQLDDPFANDNGFDYFVAQLREVFMAQEGGVAVALNEEDSGATPSPYNGQFLFDKTVSFAYGNSNPGMDISVPTLLRCITMGYAFTLDHTSTSLVIRSNLRPFATIPSEFILDATPRVFRVFPNGESSMTGLAGLSHGDYIAHQSPSTGAVSLDFLSWPSAATVTKVSRVSVVLAPTKAGLMATVSWGHADAAPGVDYAAMNATQRYATYAKDKEAPVASFRFGYSRVK